MSQFAAPIRDEESFIQVLFDAHPLAFGFIQDLVKSFVVGDGEVVA